MGRTSIANYLLPRTRDILFLIVFATAMAAGWRTLNNDGDLPRHLLMGRVILETHSIPRQELFSSVYEGRPYIAHEWLAGVIYYLSYKMLGLKGVVLLTAILIAATFLVLYSALSVDYEERFLMLIFVLWGAACTYWHWVARPHLFSMLFLAIWLALVDRISRSRKTGLWMPPALMALWGNIHAEFIAGFLVLMAYLAGWLWDYLFDRQKADRGAIKNLTLTLIFSFAASLINPFGLRTWSAIFGYMGNDTLMSTIAETRPPDFTYYTFQVELALIIASIIVLALKKGNIRSGQAFLIAGFTALAMTSGRNIHLYGVVAPFVLAGPAIEATDSVLQRKVTSAVTRIEKQLKGVVWPIAVILVCLALLLSGRLGKDYFFDPKLFPVGAVQWLEDHPQSGRMFNDFLWGGYIVWHLWPGQKDFIDSHTDMYGEATEIYLTISNLTDGWEELLDRYDVKWAILPPDTALGQELIRHEWKILYKDSTAIILREE